MADEAKIEEVLSFESEEARTAALAEIPDEPPPGVNVDSWIREQEEKEREIMGAPIKDSAEAASLEQPPVSVEEPPAQVEPVRQVEQPVVEDEEYVDFSALGKIKKSELPEDLQNYQSPQEMLKQAAHARRYANTAEEKLRQYEAKVSDLESKVSTVPQLQQQLEQLKSAANAAQAAVETKPSISSGQRAELKEKLKVINDSISTLTDLDTADVEAFQKAMKGTVDAFSGTLNELDAVKGEFEKYRKESDKKYAELSSSIKNVSETAAHRDARVQQEREQKEAERGLADLQRKNPELKTSKPLYSDDHNDVETAIVSLAQQAYGKKIESFDEVNRFVGLFNARDPGLMASLERDGIMPGDKGITPTDIRNYGILMNVYWRQRGEMIDASSGRRVPVTDWRGKRVTFPDFDATFRNMKDSGGITRLEHEAQVIDAEKRGQQQLEASLSKRDISPPVLGPTGAPPEGPEMSEEMALEILGVNEGKATIDEEKMEKLLRSGSQRGWDMWATWVRAHDAAGIPAPASEPHWKRPKATQ